MQLIYSTIDFLIPENGVTDVTSVAASINAGLRVTHNRDDGCNEGNRESSWHSEISPATPFGNYGVTLESCIYWAVTPVTTDTPRKPNRHHKHTGHNDDVVNPPDTVGAPKPLKVAYPDINVIADLPEYAAPRYWVFHYLDRVVESVFCHPGRLSDLVGLNSQAITVVRLWISIQTLESFHAVKPTY